MIDTYTYIDICITLNMSSPFIKCFFHERHDRRLSEALFSSQRPRFKSFLINFSDDFQIKGQYFVRFYFYYLCSTADRWYWNDSCCSTVLIIIYIATLIPKDEYNDPAIGTRTNKSKNNKSGEIKRRRCMRIRWFYIWF